MHKLIKLHTYAKIYCRQGFLTEEQNDIKKPALPLITKQLAIGIAEGNA